MLSGGALCYHRRSSESIFARKARHQFCYRLSQSLSAPSFTSSQASRATHTIPWLQISPPCTGSAVTKRQNHKTSHRRPPSHSPVNSPPSSPRTRTLRLRAVSDHPRTPNPTSSANKTKAHRSALLRISRRMIIMSRSKSINEVRTSEPSMTPRWVGRSAAWKRRCASTRI
jgi:hypothetical protein